MAVLQFGFDSNTTNNPHHPPNIKSDQVVYTGTHDNNTTQGWWDSLDSDVQNNIVSDFLNPDEEPLNGLIRIAKESSANMAIFPLQDLLGLGEDARMNTPGTSSDNWKWKTNWENIEKLSNNI